MNEPRPFAEPPSRLERLLTVQQLSDYLGTPVTTLYEWRSQKVGPRGVKAKIVEQADTAGDSDLDRNTSLREP